MGAGQIANGSSIAPSYVSGGSTTALLGTTIGDCFDATVRANPDRLALLVPRRKMRSLLASVGKQRILSDVKEGAEFRSRP